MTPPCTECKFCKKLKPEKETGESWYYCDIDGRYMAEEYALSNLECDIFVQKLDDHKTEE